MVPPKWIDATDLNGWANRRDAQEKLPQLLRRLINASVPHLQKIGFPAGDSVQTGGWDGIVETLEGNAFVPLGCSVWELGVGQNVKAKADADYQKRCRDPLGLISYETTFIFVTLRRWSGKDSWVKSKNAEGIWAEVRAYDADDIEQWLELAPAVHTWMAYLLGKWSDETQDLGSFWDEWIESTSPNLTSSLHLAGREHNVTKVKDWLNKSPSKLTIWADSYEEAIAFFAAIIYEMSEDEQVKYLSRCVLIKTESSWRYLSNFQNSLILIPIFNHLKFIPKNHHVLVPVGRESSPSEKALKLSCLAREGFRQSLLDMGHTEEQDYFLTKESKRNLLVLRRLLASNPEIHTPNWATPENGRLLIPALLVGAWDETKEADRQSVAALAGKPYQEVIAGILHWLNTSDPPLRKVGDVWQLVSREVTWHFLSRFLARDDLETFENVVCRILGSSDPQYELPPDQRFAASVYGRELQYSNFLRQGISETLAILSTRGLPISIQDTRTPQDRVNRIVHRLLIIDGDWERWASLSNLLPTLAEAAPESFLEALEDGLAGDSPALLKVFQESTWGDSPHTGLLWALEIFAWEPTYLSRSALILAKLSRIDPGGKLLNRPFNSLREIFLCWYPQTPATLQQRLRVIDTLLIREPTVTWKLLCSLLPEISGGISHLIYQPRWRDWNSTYTPNVNSLEYWQNIEAWVERILANAGSSSERWCDVLKRIDSLPPNLLNQVICTLENVVTTGMEPVELAAIWNDLREIIHKHRKFPDAEWAMPKESVDKLDLVHQKFTPPDLIYRYAWLFTFNPKFITSIHLDWERKQENTRKKQIETAQEILHLGGVDALVELAKHVKQPRLLGTAIANIEDITDSEQEFFQATLGQDTKALSNLAIGFVIGRMEISGWAWAEEMLQYFQICKWSSKQVADFFLGLPFEQRTWELLKSFTAETQKLYWQIIPAHWVRHDDSEIAINHLLEVNRPYAALNLAGLHQNTINESNPIKSDILIEILQKAASVDHHQECPLPDTSMISYNIERIFNALDKLEIVEANDIAKLEWIYLPVLAHSKRQPRILYRELAEDPLFFAEILKLFPRSKDDEDVSAEPDEVKATHFRLGYELLKSWRQVPGLAEDGTIDIEQLRAWVSNARSACYDCGRGKIGDQKIGRVLAFSPKGIDGIWPDIAIREIIEEMESRDIELGLEIGVYNKRGVWAKSIGEGGIQERELAKTYQDYASAVMDTYPRTAALLGRIAHRYESEAHREDVDSELEDW